MSGLTLWARRGSVEPHWQLGELGVVEPARAMLLGWAAENGVDGGVPATVVGVCSRALAATVRVAFLCDGATVDASPDWVARGDGWTRSAPTPGLIGSAIARLHGGRSPVGMACVNRAEAIANAFTDPQFAWWLQSQVLLLTRQDAPPPAVTPDQALSLLADDWPRRAVPLGRQGVVAVARPGVDGDAIGVLALDDGIVDILLAALARESRAAACAWDLRE